MTRFQDQTRRLWVVFEGGFMGLTLPFWQSYESIIRQAQEAIPIKRKVLRIEDDQRKVLWEAKP